MPTTSSGTTTKSKAKETSTSGALQKPLQPSEELSHGGRLGTPLEQRVGERGIVAREGMAGQQLDDYGDPMLDADYADSARTPPAIPSGLA